MAQKHEIHLHASGPKLDLTGRLPVGRTVIIGCQADNDLQLDHFPLSCPYVQIPYTADDTWGLTQRDTFACRSAPHLRRLRHKNDTEPGDEELDGSQARDHRPGKETRSGDFAVRLPLPPGEEAKQDLIELLIDAHKPAPTGY